jgi:hypothetical protein
MYTHKLSIWIRIKRTRKILLFPTPNWRRFGSIALYLARPVVWLSLIFHEYTLTISNNPFEVVKYVAALSVNLYLVLMAGSFSKAINLFNFIQKTIAAIIGK